ALPFFLVFAVIGSGAALAAEIRYVTIALVAMLVFALGWYTPALQLFWHLPGISLFRRRPTPSSSSAGSMRCSPVMARISC
ncbi:hypothetical protein, partial [Escherichia coli]|uniref:hypothetical protein n=1 Tax=Escherichia coli TaxID=562 RepID=UPI0013D83CBD